MAADLKDIREAFAEDESHWSDIREGRAKDIKALGPDSTWDDKDREARRQAGRPCLSFDELNQHVNNLVNDVRETKRAIAVNPGPEAQEHDARFMAAWIRQVEYRSNAQMAYSQMFEDTVQGGYGFLRIVPRYVQQKITTPSARSFEQELLIQPVHNPDLITPSYFTRPDFSDCERFWVHERYTEEQFNRTWPDADIKDFKGTSVDAGPQWVDDKGVWVRELWQLKTTRKKLALLPNPKGPQHESMAVWVDTIPKEQRRDVLKTALRERWVDEPYVCQQITNGLEVLEEKTDWKGKYIPIVGCVGKILWIKDKRLIGSLIRNSHDPQQMLNYYRTSEGEEVGMTPKVPSFAYKGTLDQKNLAALVAANQVPVGVVQVETMPEGWQPAWGPPSFPVKTPYAPNIQAFEVGAESTRRGIQAAIATGFLPTDAQRQNQKSGVALRQIETSAQKGAYHFVDHFEMSLARGGAILVDLAPYYLDTAREVHVRGTDDQTAQIRINDETAAAPKDYGGQPIMVTPEREFDVTISTGPSYATEREKASEFADQLVGARPETFMWLADLIFKLKDLGPVGDKMAERAKAMLPPAIQQLESGNQPLPPQAQQAMAQLQQAQQMIQQLQRAIETEQVKGQTQIELKQIDGQIKLALAKLQGQQKLQLLGAEVAADIDTREDEQMHDMALKGADVAHASEQAERAAAEARRTDSTRHLMGGPMRYSEESTT